MITLSLISLWVSLSAVAAISRIFARQVKTAELELAGRSPSRHNAVIEPFFLLLEHRLAAAERYLAHLFWAAFLSALDRFLPVFRHFSARIENWLLRLLQMVRGRRELNYLGRHAASSHLEELRSHAEEVRSNNPDSVHRIDDPGFDNRIVAE